MEQSGRIPVWTFGERLAKARKDAGLSQEQMADVLLVSRQTVVGWERDQHRPPRRKLVAWALRTGVDLVWILQDDERTGQAGGRGTGWFRGHRAIQRPYLLLVATAHDPAQEATVRHIYDHRRPVVTYASG